MSARTSSLTLSVQQAADMLGQSRSAIYDGVARGVIPNVGVGRRVCIPRVWIEERFAAAGASLSRVETVEERVFS